MKKSALFILPILLFASCNNDNATYYQIELDANGGNVEKETIKVSSNSFSLPTPTKEGKNFLGWYSGYSDEDYLIDSFSKLEDGMTIYAKWDKYDLFYLNGDDSVLFIDTVNSNELASPTSRTAYKKENNKAYTFLNWDFDYSININKDYYIYPTWKEVDYKNYSVHLLGYASSKDDVEYPFIYKEDIFDKDSFTFNKDLLTFAYSISLASVSVEELSRVFTLLGYDNFQYEDYGAKEIGAVPSFFAHKKIGDNDVIVVTTQGFLYTVGWISNFDSGKEGNHKGFYESGLVIYERLKEYLKTNFSNLDNVKILSTGFSRAGALSNVLGYLLNSDDELTNKNNIYTYTFESPNCLSYKNLKGYKNIFNIVNNADIIASFPPHEYDTYREGIDIDIYDLYFEKYLHDCFSDIDVPAYNSKNTDYPTDVENMHLLLNKMMGEYETYLKLDNREHYVDTSRATFEFVVTLILFNTSTFAKVADDIQKDSSKLLIYITNPDKFTEYLMKFFNEDGVDVNEEELLMHITYLSDFILNGLGMSYITTILTNRGNLIRLAFMHMPETDYALILHAYHNKW